MTIDALTDEQRAFADHAEESFLEACPGSGKTRAIVARVCRLCQTLPSRKGVAILSFTNTAVDEFRDRIRRSDCIPELSFPSFVGTFDAFVRHFFVYPMGIQHVATRPRIVDSWSRFDSAIINLRGQKALKSRGISLDHFDPINNTLNLSALWNTADQAKAKANKTELENAARYRRSTLLKSGVLSAADARVVALERVCDPETEKALSEALKGRFIEVVVDEAQDCNAYDIAVLEFLKSAGIPTTVVCDLDQSIYEFRDSTPGKLRDFSNSYATGDRLKLTGNFRSSKTICELAGTLKSKGITDDAVGKHKDISSKVVVIEYEGRSPAPSIGKTFQSELHQCGIDFGKAIIIAHSRNAALRACGKPTGFTQGNSNVSKVAASLAAFRNSNGSGRAREKAIEAIERIILDRIGLDTSNQTTSALAAEHKLERRWLRRIAFVYLSSLSEECDKTTEAMSSWIETARAELDKLNLPVLSSKTTTQFLMKPTKNDWVELLRPDEKTDIRCATVHEAKGREYEAVCFVISPNSSKGRYADELLDAWESQADEEACRVAYVGVTRAQKLLAIAVQKPHRERLTNLLKKSTVQYRLEST